MNDAILIPASALLKTPEGTTTVMVMGNDNRAHQVSVEPGIRQGDHVQITKGLGGGEKVITAGAYGLPNETKVKIAEVASPEGGKAAERDKAESEKSPADEKKPAGKDKE